MNRLSFHKSILAWFSLAFIILVIVSYSSYLSFKKFAQEQEMIDHTYMVMDSVNSVLTNLLDAQSAQRGYILTGQDDNLARYSIAIPEIHSRLSALKTLLQDNPAQEARLRKVESIVELRLNALQEILDVYREQGAAAALDMIKIGTGRKEMAEARIIIAEMLAEETRFLDMRKMNAAQTNLMTLKISGTGMAVCMLILILVFWTIYKESEKRGEIENSLQLALDNMEETTKQTSLLGKLSDYMQSCQSAGEAFKVIHKWLPQLLTNTSGAVGVFGESRNLVETMARWGEGASAIPKDFNPDHCWGLRRGRAHYFVPEGTEPCCEHFTETPKGASLCLPMQAQGETIGIFTVMIDHISQTSKDKVAFCRRVSEQISLAIANLNLQHRLREQSIRDPLTHLFNRRYLESTLEREILRAERNKLDLSVLILDIDYFKKFNDTMGHDAGDALLSQFAAMLEQNVRKEDIVCRYGGEEFVIVLPQASLAMAVERGKKIGDATRNMKIKSTNKEIKSVSVSIGVAAFPDHGSTGTDLITLADEALYQSKKNGRDRVTAYGSFQTEEAAPPIVS